MPTFKDFGIEPSFNLAARPLKSTVFSRFAVPDAAPAATAKIYSVPSLPVMSMAPTSVKVGVVRIW